MAISFKDQKSSTTILFQIGSITLHAKPEGTRSLMVSQPGGTFVTLYSSNSTIEQTEDGQMKVYAPSSYTLYKFSQ